MLATPDWEKRKQLTAELGQFTFEQVIGIPLYTRKVVWPLGEKLDQWGIQARQTEFLSNWEYAPHGT
jgi:ABC-type transport system substrate-binding protein